MPPLELKLLLTRRLTGGPPVVFGPSPLPFFIAAAATAAAARLEGRVPTLTASSHSFTPLADIESGHGAHLDALHFPCSCLFPAAERLPPLPGTRHCTLSVVHSPRARLICGAINSPSLRSLLTDIPHACLRSTLIMHLLAMIVAATRPHVCIDGVVGRFWDLQGYSVKKVRKKKRHCVQKSGFLEVSYQRADGVRAMVSDADSDAGSASWAVVFKVKRNTKKTRKTKITSGFVTCPMTCFTLT